MANIQRTKKFRSATLVDNGDGAPYFTFAEVEEVSVDGEVLALNEVGDLMLPFENAGSTMTTAHTAMGILYQQAVAAREAEEAAMAAAEAADAT